VGWSETSEGFETMADRLRLGFIGCGSHSSRTLQPNARLVDQIELVGMCDLDATKAQAAALRWGTAAYDDVEVMLAEAAPDAVVVVGPPTMMQPLTKEMLGRGLHVFTEKPAGGNGRTGAGAGGGVPGVGDVRNGCNPLAAFAGERACAGDCNRGRIR